MTSAPGEGQDPRYGRPDQSYGPPPGYAPPPGYGPPGYAPPPPAGFGAPQHLDRPPSVRLGIGAFVLEAVLGLVGTGYVFTRLDALVADQGVAVSADAVRAGLVAGAVVGLVLLALYAMFLWFAWQGRNWARVVIWVLAGLSVLSALFSLGGQVGVLVPLALLQVLLQVAGIVLLALPPSNDWYRYRGWARANGQR